MPIGPLYTYLYTLFIGDVGFKYHKFYPDEFFNKDLHLGVILGKDSIASMSIVTIYNDFSSSKEFPLVMDSAGFINITNFLHKLYMPEFTPVGFDIKIRRTGNSTSTV